MSKAIVVGATCGEFADEKDPNKKIRFGKVHIVKGRPMDRPGQSGFEVATYSADYEVGERLSKAVLGGPQVFDLELDERNGKLRVTHEGDYIGPLTDFIVDAKGIRPLAKGAQPALAPLRPAAAAVR